jgi:hypothetical protein
LRSICGGMVGAMLVISPISQRHRDGAVHATKIVAF